MVARLSAPNAWNEGFDFFIFFSTDLRLRLALPPTAIIAFHSLAHPSSSPVVLGDGIVNSSWWSIPASPSTGLPLFADPPLAPESNYTVFVAVMAGAGDSGHSEETMRAFAVSPTHRLVFRTREVLPVERAPAASSRGALVGMIFGVLLLICALLSLLAWFLLRYSHLRRKVSILA